MEPRLTHRDNGLPEQDPTRIRTSSSLYPEIQFWCRLGGCSANSRVRQWEGVLVVPLCVSSAVAFSNHGLADAVPRLMTPVANDVTFRKVILPNAFD